MLLKITPEQKTLIIKSLYEYGNITIAAHTAHCSPSTIYSEMARNDAFRERAIEARLIGNAHKGDKSEAMIMKAAWDTDSGITKTQLTANAMLSNAYIPGFKGATNIQGHIDHDIHVITGIPRPQYPDAIELIPVKQLPTPDQKRLARNAYMSKYQKARRAEAKAIRIANKKAQSITTATTNSITI
jgi:hypothetical protein